MYASELVKLSGFGTCLMDACRDGASDPEEQLADLQTQLAAKDDKIDELEAYIANIMKEGLSNNVVLKEFHDALAAKDSAIAELQAYIDSELRAESQDEEEQEAAEKSGMADSAPAEDDSDSAQPESLSYGQATLRISQLKAQIHRLESRMDSSSSDSSSNEEVQAEEDVQKSWWSAKADSLTAEVVRLQTEAAEAEEQHAVSLQVSLLAKLWFQSVSNPQASKRSKKEEVYVSWCQSGRLCRRLGFCNYFLGFTGQASCIVKRKHVLCIMHRGGSPFTFLAGSTRHH